MFGPRPIRIRLLAVLCLCAAADAAHGQVFRVHHLAGPYEAPSSRDGTGTDARFSGPAGIAVDALGNAYINETGSARIRKMTAGLAVTTVAESFTFSFPESIAADAAGNVYVANRGVHTIVKITPDGTATTLAGTAGVKGSTDAVGTAALFNQPAGIAVDGSGNVFVTDYGGCTIRKISPGALVTTLAGTAGQCYTVVDGTGSAARFGAPEGIAVDGTGVLYVGDGTVVRKVTPAGVVTTFSGAVSDCGFVDGPPQTAEFCYVEGLAVGPDGTVYVADTGNNAIRRVTAGGEVTTLAGAATVGGQPGAPGYEDGTGGSARFAYPMGIAYVASSDSLLVADHENNTIRHVTLSGEVTTVAGIPNGSGLTDGGPFETRFDWPKQVAADPVGNLFVTEWRSGLIRSVRPDGATSTVAALSVPTGIAVGPGGDLLVTSWNSLERIDSSGQVATFAGALSSGSADGTGTVARFRSPKGVTRDAAGAFYVADTGNHTIRAVTPAAVVTTVAGLALSPGSEDGTGPGARFKSPEGVAVASDGTVYVSDTGNHTIRRITPGGVVTTLAGLAGSSGYVDAPGGTARFNGPRQLLVHPSGSVFVADRGNYAVRRVTPAGVVSTVAGGQPGNSYGAGIGRRFSTVEGIALDGAGRLLVSDAGNHAIRQLLPSRDTNGDGIPEVVVYRPGTGEWFVRESGTANQLIRTFGSGADKPIPGDYDGDGLLDIAVYRPSAGTWFVLTSASGYASYTANGWGVEAEGDTPVPGDYDGDGKWDRAVYRAKYGTWFLLRSATNNTAYWAIGWGDPTDTPMPADYDGDGRTDIAVYRPETGQWFLRFSASDFQATTTVQFGKAGDTPMPADYDADGRADIAVYRPATGTWFVLQSSSKNTKYTSVGWGVQAEGDTPVPGDFDGDGKADACVFRPAYGTWFVLRSSSGNTQYSATGWGQVGDRPIAGQR